MLAGRSIYCSFDYLHAEQPGHSGGREHLLWISIHSNGQCTLAQEIRQRGVIPSCRVAFAYDNVYETLEDRFRRVWYRL